MAIRPDEIAEILKRQLEQYEPSVEFRSSGIVLSVGDGIARVYGLQQAMSGELIEFPNDLFGVALNLEEDNVGCILMGAEGDLKEGDTARCTGRLAEVPVGEAVLGRVIDPLGRPMDGKGDVPQEKTSPIEVRAPGVIERQPVEEPLQTGIKAVDAMTPIGRGQRELIIGDRQTGKTALAIDTIINQRDTDVVCIYVAIGQKTSTVAQVQKALEDNGAMDNTVLVNAAAADSAALQYIAPYSGTAIGEFFRDAGKHALIVYDDLSKHAAAYRQVSLLLRRPPGREAFPGDIFNLHSRLLERSAKLSDKLGAGTLTALPIVETQLGDYSAYIPTNVISITDGQIYLESDLFYSGVRPAMNVGISVSRVGGSAQIPAMKQVAGRLRLDLAQYREVEAFAQFSSDLDAATQQQLRRGQRMVELLKQNQYEPMSVFDQVLGLFAGANGILDQLEVREILPFEKHLIEFVKSQRGDVYEKLKGERKLSDELRDQLKDACQAALEAWQDKTKDELGLAQ